MQSGIYKIESLHGKLYIGSAVNLHVRRRTHFNQLTKDIHYNHKLQNDYNTFGNSFFTFDVLEYCTRDKLLYYEQIWLDILFSSLESNEIYNTSHLAISCIGKKISVDTRNKQSTAKKGRMLSDETRLKMSLARSNKSVKYFC